MKHTKRFAITLGAALTMLALAAQAQAGPQATAYVVYDTGTLGGTFAFGAGINNLGWVTGASTNAAGALHATLAGPGTLIGLGTLGGMNSAVEWAHHQRCRRDPR